MKSLRVFLALVCAGGAAWAERINHEGRLLGPAPVVSQPILFNTPEADAVVAAMQIMPATHPWNERVDQRPLLANSAQMIAQITADLASNRRTLRPFFEMNFVLVPDSQPAQPIEFFNWPDESDLDGGATPYGLYPIPATMPVEGWPVETGALSLEEWQLDLAGAGGDRHSIVVKPGAGEFWETWLTKRVGAAWRASNGAKWSLASNALRPAGWTSADAAGLAMFPAVVRFDECQRGMVEHALRLIVKRTRLGPIYPATHQASVPPTSDPNVPAMGQRLRLKASFAIPPAWTIQEKAVLRALKKYGAIVADNGGFFSVSVSPDDRFPAGCFDRLRTIGIEQFEVVQTTGALEGPRSPGAPTVDAGPDLTVALGAAAALSGSVAGPGVVQWKVGAGPGAVAFADGASASTSATFTHPGRYTLVLSADDSTHAVSYDAAVVTVVMPIALTAEPPDVLVHFPTLPARTYRIEHTSHLTDSPWTPLASGLGGAGGPYSHRDPLALQQPRRFYRVVAE